MPYLTPRDPHIITGLEDFGVAIVEARARSAMSQSGLEFRSGVSQSAISRAEQTLAPRLALDRVIGMKLCSVTNFLWAGARTTTPVAGSPVSSGRIDDLTRVTSRCSCAIAWAPTDW